MTNRKSMNQTGWNFDNSYARLPDSFFTKINPNVVDSPNLVILNEPLAASLGLNKSELQNEENVKVLAGNLVPDGAMPLAQAYAGHQFGHLAMLGDGRAMLIGEQITPSNERVDIQLKGSGKTPYSRGGDGRATIGPMLREYIISEAMHALGIPTTRSLAVVTTGESVIRERMLPGAVLTRVASSHLRFGTFQYAAGMGSVEDLKTLADYAINRHYPEIAEAENKYLSLLQAVMKRHAALIAKWQLVGFIHGVMNTDNMTISGETIDYGPCAFMDKYDPKTVFSSIDVQGRYAYKNQPVIGGWNLARFAESLLPLLHENQESAVEMAQDAISEYNGLFQRQWLDGMRAKLGLFNKKKEDEALIENLLGLMEKYQSDFTNTFRALSNEKVGDTEMFGASEFTEWYEVWQERLERQNESKDAAYKLMRGSNPAVIPRNHRVEEALQAAVEHEDYSVIKKLLDVLLNPYENTDQQRNYCTPAPKSDGPYRTYCGT